MSRGSKQSIGALLVHGIGEQGRFEHLESEVRRIATAMDAEPTVRFTRVSLNTSSHSAFSAKQLTWQSGEKAPVTLEAVHTNGDVTEIDFREVWWADLDEPTGLWYRVRFWFWALSMWATQGYMKSTQTGYAEWMRPISPLDARVRFIDRVRLFIIGVVLLLPVMALSFVNFILGRVFRIQIPGEELLVSYIGDVKLYQQKRRHGKGPIVDLGQAPRVSIRRRMVRSLVQMALGGYDRWYILAHSLGTVVSLNGLMDPEQRLPHYLDERTWQDCKAKLGGTLDEPLTEDEIDGMFPRRPTWLAPDEILDRSKLFEKLQGYLTYGAPAEKFAVLWPAIVPMNKDENVFAEGFQWINVIDTTDPVAGKITRFTLGRHGPANFRYKAGLFHLLSHTRYLSYSKRRKHTLVSAVTRWLLNGGRFEEPKKNSSVWPGRRRVWLQATAREVTWIVVGILFAWFLGWRLIERLPWYAGLFPEWVHNLAFGGKVIIGLSPAFFAALVAGVGRRLPSLKEPKSI